MKEWIKRQWKDRPWLLGLIAGALCAFGYWLWRKTHTTSSNADTSGVTTYTTPTMQSGDTGASGGGIDTTDPTASSQFSDMVAQLQAAQQQQMDLLQQEITQTQGTTQQEIQQSQSALQQALSALQTKFDNALANLRGTSNVTTQPVTVAATPVTATVSPTTTPVATVSPPAGTASVQLGNLTVTVPTGQGNVTIPKDVLDMASSGAKSQAVVSPNGGYSMHTDPLTLPAGMTPETAAAMAKNFASTPLGSQPKQTIQPVVPAVVVNSDKPAVHTHATVISY